MLNDGLSLLGNGTEYSESESEYSAPNTESYLTQDCSEPVLGPYPIVLELENDVEFIDPDVLASAMNA